MSSKKPKLADIIDRISLQQLQDSISKAMNISTIILDSSGVPITKMANGRKICERLGDPNEPEHICHKTQRKLWSIVRETHKAASMICAIPGMTSISVPILLDDSFLGAWVIGPVRFFDGPLPSFTDVMDKAGIDQAIAQELFEDIPVFRESEFEAIIEFMLVLTKAIVKITAKNLEINTKNKQLVELSDSFEYSMAALRALANTPDVSIYLSDFYTGEVLMCNNTYASSLGKTWEELVGTMCFGNLGFNSRCPFCPNDKLIDENSKPLPPHTWENYFEHLGVYLQVTNQAVYWVDGRLVNMSVSIDITERKKMENELFELAFFDQILKIPNYERMEQDMREGRRFDYLVAVDLGDLRKINNIFGRAFGDALLKVMRDYILDMNIPSCTLYRGKIADFGILFSSVQGNKNLPRKVAEKLHKRCKKSWEVCIDEQRQNIFTSASVCVLPMEDHHENYIDYIYGAVEHSLEMARKIDGVVVYNDDTREMYYTELRLEVSLKNAVRENMRGFHIAYQPIVDIGVAKWTGVEVLCRWNSPEFGTVPPDMFIPVAETSGLISTIGLWVLEQSIFQIKAWGLDRIDGFLLEVNLSPIQFTIPNLDQIIMRILKKHDYPPEKLGLEVTESSELNFSHQTMEAIERLSELGVVIVLDDFGTGYSSFNSLHKLPVKILKTDRSFITGMESDDNLRKLLCVMIALAHGSEMKLVAEGVESDFQAQFLLKQGVDLFQGYLFSRPLTAEQLIDELDNFHRPIENLMSMGYAKWDLLVSEEKWAEHEEYGLTPMIYKLLNRCVREIFTNPDSNNAIDMLLAYIGEDLRVSRTYVFLKEPDGTYSNTHEWCAPGIVSEKDNLQHVPIDHMYSQWTETLRREGLLVASDIRTLEEELYEVLDSQGIKAVVEFPLWRDQELYGFVGIDDCNNVHSWMRDEVQMLHTLTGLISSALGKLWLEEEISTLDKMRVNILNTIDTIIYVSDLETNIVLFANKAMQQAYNNSSLQGRVCWEVLQNKRKRCEFCPLSYLLKNPGMSYEWEFYNEVLGRHFRIQDSIIPWIGGKNAHLECAVDITDLKKNGYV